MKPGVDGRESLRARASTQSQSASVDLRLLVIATVDQDFLPVGLVDDHRLEQMGRHHLHTIFVGGGVVHRDVLPLSTASTISAVTPGRARVSFEIVEYC